MALVDKVLADNLEALYKDMAKTPMETSAFAARMAAILDAQTKTAEVQAGISVDGGTAKGDALVGCATSAKGSVS